MSEKDLAELKRQLCLKEHQMLRDELHNLKECQIKFLTLAVTASGVLLGLPASLGAKVGSGTLSIPPVAYLFPLVILLPFWWIFFDKATTITRIVGYYRVLEKIVLGTSPVDQFIGWENALGQFRDKTTRLPEKYRWKSLLVRSHALVRLGTSHRYWVLSYHTFLWFCVLSLVLTLHFLPGGIVQSIRWVATIQWWYEGNPNGFFVLVAATSILVSALWNAWTVMRLMSGRNSYDANEQQWEEILKLRTAAESQEPRDAVEPPAERAMEPQYEG